MSVAALPRRRTGNTPLSPLATLLVALVWLIAWPSPAWAHTDFEGSDPVDGQSVAGPVDRVTVTFTNPAQESGEGFVVLDSTGTPVESVSVETEDGTAFVLRFDPPLDPGEYGVRWEVQAGDAHPIDGTFRFVVTGAATPTTEPTPEPGPDEDTSGLGRTSGLDEALDDTGSGDNRAAASAVARVMTISGALFGLGALASLVWVVRGRRGELSAILGWIRLAGLTVAVGSTVEVVVLAQTQPGGLGDLLGQNAGVAAALRLAGGIAVAAGFPPRTAAAFSARDPEPGDGPDDAGLRWAPSRAAAAGVAGFALVLASFWFDGHTVTRGPWALHAASNLVHLVAAAVWAGGVFVMTALVWRRRRRGLPGDGAWLVIRFSPLAAASLTAVVIAGVAMAAIVLNSPEELWSTEWGRVLLAKTTVVGVAAVMGAVNHRHLRPALERDPTSPALARTTRRTLTIESVVFVAIIALTTWLVAAAT